MKKFVLTFILIALSSFAFSDEPKSSHALEGKFIFGTSAFIDEDIPFDHSIMGGSIPIRISDKLSVEPQFLYMKGPRSDRDLTLTGNVIYNLTTRERFTFYVVGGAGLLRHTQRFGTDEFSSYELTANGGIGARIFLTRRLFIAPEFRFGWEPLMTTTAAIGYSF